MTPTELVPFRSALLVWLKIGCLNFGGPAGQIALMHRLLVEERRWISEERFLHALNYCMLLPGPEAQQLATYIGWLLHGTRGGLVAGLLFILPGFVLMVAISALFLSVGQQGWMQSLLLGLQAATLAIVAEAILRLGRKALKGQGRLLLALSAFVAIFALQLPFPLIIAAAALAGVVGPRWAPGLFPAAGKTAEATPAPAPAASAWSRALRTLSLGALLWFSPTVLLWLSLGAEHVYTQQAFFFSKMAVVTFGGAYAVLAYMAQQAVSHYGWLLPGEMVQGLALAETTPGPLILVLTYVGFLGAYRDPGSLDPMSAGLLGAVLCTWVSFVPCFLWIFLGAPHIERLRQNTALAAALAGITAAVVGVIANLALWFALHVLWAEVDSWQGPLGIEVPMPQWSSLNPTALGLTALALLAMLGLKWGLGRTLLLCALASLGLQAWG